MPRLVRRKPLMQRISAWLNPMDMLLWLSEEMETRDWDSKQLGTQIGIGLNFLFLVVRANYGSNSKSDDVFSEEDSGSGWVSWIVFPLVWGLALFSFTNALYTISRNRKYRLFEANIDVQPATPSARRVQVQSAPASSSPLRFITGMIAADSPDARAHPDKSRDVWELSVWDPLPISLRMFCFLSPGHILVYLVFLPLAPLDPRPSMTVFNTLVMQIVLSGQLLFLCTRFSQQAQDSAILQKEVMHEYDTKFVHPMLHPVVRDVGVQASDDTGNGAAEIEVGTPTTLIRRTFKTNGNPHIEGGEPTTTHANVMKPQLFTPTPGPRRSEVFVTPTTGFRSPRARNSLPASASTNSIPYTSTGTNFAGHLGAYTQTNSPLKKTISMNDVTSQDQPSPRNSREMAAYEQRNIHHPSSPLKQAEARHHARASSGPGTGVFANTARNRIHQQENARPRW